MSSSAGKFDYSNRPIWLLCEGNDCYFFFMRVAEKLGLTNINCIDAKGINDAEFFKKVAKITNYNIAKVILYVRDAEYIESEPGNSIGETHIASVIKSIQSRFESIGLSVGNNQLELTANGTKRAGYIILTDKNGISGTLEDLCLDIAVDTDAVDDASSTINHINEKRDGKVEKHAHKRKLHIAFALNSKDSMVGARTGEAVKFGGLDLNHDRFKPIREFLENANKQFIQNAQEEI